MEELVRGPLATALEVGRARFNALFAQAKHQTPTLDASIFGQHLRSTVAPIVNAVAGIAPERVDEVVDVLFEFSLELIGKDFLGRYPVLTEGWSNLLMGLPHHLAAAPRLYAGSITNALYNLAQVPGTRPTEWTECLLQAGRVCPDVPTLLDAGKVAAWRAGMAHHRDNALEICGRLPADIAQVVLGLPPGGNGNRLPTILGQLRADPWLDPATIGQKLERPLRMVGSVGGFRGFGGPFLRPPRVAFAQGQFQVSDAERCWILSADRFGATLRPIGTSLPVDESATTFQIDSKGTVRYDKESRAMDELRNPTSRACNATTLAVTIALSHAVYLVARSELP